MCWAQGCVCGLAACARCAHCAWRRRRDGQRCHVCVGVSAGAVCEALLMSGARLDADAVAHATLRGAWARSGRSRSAHGGEAEDDTALRAAAYAVARAAQCCWCGGRCGANGWCAEAAQSCLSGAPADGLGRRRAGGGLLAGQAGASWPWAAVAVRGCAGAVRCAAERCDVGQRRKGERRAVWRSRGLAGADWLVGVWLVVLDGGPRTIAARRALGERLEAAPTRAWLHGWATL